MSSRGKRVLSGAAVTLVLLLAAYALWLTVLPAATAVDVSDWPPSLDPTVKGAFHVHTRRSDGSGTPDEIAAAAEMAGLDFLIFTDHGDGTRAPDPPQYRSTVLCLDGVEISTSGGHYIAVGLLGTPYPLGGDPASVVEDVRRMGGFGVVAHPTSAKPALAWRDWGLQIDGIEWLNGDSQWRDESWGALLVAASRYPFFPSGALASLLDRPSEVLRRWDDPVLDGVVGLAGADVHARLSTGGGGQGHDDTIELGLPGYMEVFRTFALRIVLDRAWTGDAWHDARLLIDGLHSGRTFTAIDALAGPVRFTFEARAGDRTVGMGERVIDSTAVELRAAVAGPPDAEIVLFGDGEPVVRSGMELHYRAPDSAMAYRVEVYVSGAPGSPPMPWIVSNPIYVGLPRPVPTPAVRVPITSLPLERDDTRDSWQTEHDPESTASVQLEHEGVVFNYRLADSPHPNVSAAAVYAFDPGTLVGLDGLVFEARADRPMRLFVQLRAGTVPGQPRWRRSFFADTTSQLITVAFDELAPVELQLAEHPDLESIDAVLIVMDRTNGLPGSVGRVTLTHPRVEQW